MIFLSAGGWQDGWASRLPKILQRGKIHFLAAATWPGLPSLAGLKLIFVLDAGCGA